ncbi:MAG: metallophosphoesterase family protein [Bacillota bacterium]
MIYFTSDSHFFHKNIITYCNRPYSNIEDMNKDIIKKWNSKVLPGDTVYHLGDFCFNPYYVPDIISKLNAKQIILICGNHDSRIWKKRDIFNDTKLQIAGYNTIHEINYQGLPIILCHFPMLSWPKKSHGSVHFFGHIHNVSRDDIQPNSCNVGVDCWDFYPVDIETAIKTATK